jgi:hypothetical protein
MQRQLIEAGMTLGHDRMMYADGFLLPHLAASRQVVLPIFLLAHLSEERQSHCLFCQQVGWHLFLIPVSVSEASLS